MVRWKVLQKVVRKTRYALLLVTAEEMVLQTHQVREMLAETKILWIMKMIVPPCSWCKRRTYELSLLRNRAMHTPPIERNTEVAWQSGFLHIQIALLSGLYQ